MLHYKKAFCILQMTLLLTTVPYQMTNLLMKMELSMKFKILLLCYHLPHLITRLLWMTLSLKMRFFMNTSQMNCH